MCHPTVSKGKIVIPTFFVRSDFNREILISLPGQLLCKLAMDDVQSLSETAPTIVMWERGF